MKQLTLIRHAEAVPTGPGGRDLDRPLHPRGLAWLHKLGPMLQALGPWPTLWLTSPSTRTRETAASLRAFAPQGPEATPVQSLYLAEPRDIVRALTLEARDHDSVLVCGHNPGLEVMVGILLGDPRVDFRPGSALVIELACPGWGALLQAERKASHLVISDPPR